MPKINIDPRMRDNYALLLGISVVVIAIVFLNLFGNANRKHDAKLETAIRDQKAKIDSYINKNKKLPDTPLDAKITETKGVEYNKISDSKYMLCADFKTKSDGYQPKYTVQPDDPLLGGGGINLDSAQSVNTKFVDGDKSFQKHDEGYSCIVYEPYQLKTEYLYKFKACNDNYKSSIVSRSIKEIDSESGTITVGYSYTSGKDYRYTYKAKDAKILSNNCEEISLDDLSVGDEIDVYSKESTLNYNSNNVTVDTVKIYKKSTISN
ncbi:hypothetical protein KDA00_01355 [Candidatus Saccharibacteria bacterium]|nr:hypothetical protein [Candidatus Saccharibacteria bacterium]